MMSNASVPKAVQVSCRVYERLLALYPAVHVREYGPAMEQLFRDQCRDAWTEAGRWGLAALWLRVIGDLLKTAALEHFHNLKWRKAMLNQTRLAFRTNPAVRTTFRFLFTAVFLLVLGGSVLLAFLAPKQYASTARVKVFRNSAEATPPRYQRYVEGGYDPYFIQKQFELIESDAVLGPVARKLNLAVAWGNSQTGGAKLSEAETVRRLKDRLALRPVRGDSLFTLTFSATNDAAAAALAGKLAQGSLLEIRALSRSPGEAADIANAVAESYRQFWADQFRRTAASTAPKPHVVEIVDRGVPALRPTAPNRPFTIFLGFSGGLMFAFVAAAAVAFVMIVRRGSVGAQPSLS